MTDMQALLSALDVFSRAPDKASLESANSWLQDFQHSPEAWAACNILLQNPDAPPAAKLFAAQTFRSKVTYDLHQVAPENLPSLRDTIIAALHTYHTGPRNIIVQLCLALAGLALQMPDWENPVQQMVDSFGMNPATVPTLLQFLTTLPEELTGNTKIPVTDDEYRDRATALMTNNAQRLLELLSMYYGAHGVTITVRTQIFRCLRSWLVAGEVSASDFAQTPLFAGVFESLASDELFDPAVDVICELIHETQEIDDNMQVIQLIVPRLIELKPDLQKYQEDPDRIRGYARIFTEAGETYRLLLLEHTETFFPIVEAIGECSAYHDLDIVPLTFPFWMRLAQNIGKKPSVSPLFLEAYQSLMRVIIGHLHFPADLSTMTDQETEAFRSFRHVMGDTLKDCCFVLRADTCLLAAYQMITTALARGPEAVTWQEIEAPLFAMRSMGAEVDPRENVALAQILDLIPSLPTHPRVRYAALLIIARYSEWIAEHPSYIPAQLQYVSAGFEDSDPEVCAAAGQALKYICQDCKAHLVDFLPTLHTFLGTTGPKLNQEDRKQVYEAIAHVISAMKMEAASESLRTFALDILAQVHKITTQATPPTKEDMTTVNNGLENLDILLRTVGTFGEQLPKSCEKTCEQAWAVFDAFLVKFGGDVVVADLATQALRRGLDFFGDSALAVAPAVIARMSFSFEATGISSYLWIPGKIIARFGNDDDPNLRGSFKEFYERSTQKVVSLLQAKDPRQIPDVLEDYVQTLVQLAELAPDIFFESSSFPYAFRASLGTLQVVHSDVIFIGLELFRIILTHDALEVPRAGKVPPPKFPIYAAAIKSTVEKEGFDLLTSLLTGLTEDHFPEDSISNIVEILRALVTHWPTGVVGWLPPMLEGLPATAVPAEAKRQFLTDVQAAVNSAQYDKVKYAILGFTRASRKMRDRRRTGL
ncbi:mRNA transport regulator [Coprinopsis cinerea okayama7|uniref:mRNA transport regulator n=1 Tax=Coprinopsis cinerea (strain Okayama-7 / 130 / ATCC MYA-4618 / FGSC 9003) TaxID=240176 RepID=A8N150_COPC7|nr:mRNA transport regulator [Coprinopsis cinerea okayama7\|eukprot:XP_001828600.1 mRNA transport regulator [Coprinopsis cinerea okayama7\